jgi:predicted nucleotidyltransferase
MLENCHESIRKTINEIAQETATKSIWLIGSRANSRAREDSDWDILVFREDEKVLDSARQKKLDVLQVSPSGFYFVEGRPSSSNKFDNFCWSRISEDRASYIGYDFEKKGVKQDFSQAPVDRPPLVAILIYERKTS